MEKLYFSITSPYNLVLDLASKPTWAPAAGRLSQVRFTPCCETLNFYTPCQSLKIGAYGSNPVWYIYVHI